MEYLTLSERIDFSYISFDMINKRLLNLFFLSRAAGLGERFRQECCAWHGELSFICAHSGRFRPPISAVEAAKSIKCMAATSLKLLSLVGKRLAVLGPKHGL